MEIQPPEANVKDKVAVRLMIGIPAQSSPYPRITPIAPKAKSVRKTACLSVVRCMIRPNKQPQMVWAAVGIKLMAIQCPPLNFHINCKSI